jgi:predicted methyltransferase
MASKAKMFNREAANPKNKPEEILKTLALQQGEKIADIGAGGGYFSLKFYTALLSDHCANSTQLTLIVTGNVPLLAFGSRCPSQARLRSHREMLA